MFVDSPPNEKRVGLLNGFKSNNEDLPEGGGSKSMSSIPGSRSLSILNCRKLSPVTLFNIPTLMSKSNRTVKFSYVASSHCVDSRTYADSDHCGTQATASKPLSFGNSMLIVLLFACRMSRFRNKSKSVPAWPN